MNRFLAFLLGLTAWISLSFVELQATPLDDYVNTPDDHYGWSVQNSHSTSWYSVYFLKLDSQKWKTEQEVDKPIWSHSITIVIPATVKSSTAIFTIYAGQTDTMDPPPATYLIQAALALDTIVCEINFIPFQPLKFVDEFDSRYKKIGRREDALVAYTWDKFLRTGDSSWPLRLPMTKAIVRGMDAIQEFCSSMLPLNHVVDDFILIGTSKRGWTAWTTAAVDNRVRALIPVVMDLFNLRAAMIRHYEAYGTWSFALKDYMDIDLHSRWHSERFNELMKIEEPYEYRDRFVMPKLIVNATGDEFFLPDSSQLYLHDLPGDTHLFYVANTGHSLDDGDYLYPILAYIHHILHNKPLPKINWKLTEENILEINCSSKPVNMHLWQAHNSNARDFRLVTIGETWYSREIPLTPDGKYKIQLQIPKKGWSAFYVELTFDEGGPLPLRFTTDVFVLPNIFPFKYKEPS